MRLLSNLCLPVDLAVQKEYLHNIEQGADCRQIAINYQYNLLEPNYKNEHCIQDDSGYWEHKVSDPIQNLINLISQNISRGRSNVRDKNTEKKKNQLSDLRYFMMKKQVLYSLCDALSEGPVK